MKLEIRWDDAATQRSLHDIGGRLENPRTLLGMLGDELLDYERQAFATSGFGTWAPDSPATASAKSGGRVLVDTGALQRSLTGAGAVAVEGEDVAVRTSERSAAYLRAGARGAPRRNPTPKPSALYTAAWSRSAARYITTGYR